MRDEGTGIGFWGLGFKIAPLKVQGVGFQVQCLRFRVCD